MFKRSLNWVRMACFALLAIVALLFAADAAAGFFGISIPALTFLPHLSPNSMVLMAMPAVVAPFPVDPDMTAVVIAYKNPRGIADNVLRRMPVGKQNFKYPSFPKGTFLTITETATGRTAKPRQVEMGYEELDSSTVNQSLDVPIPNDDIENAPPGYDPRMAGAELGISLVDLKREARVAAMVTDTSNYDANHYATLSSTSQFSHASSTPIKTIKDGIANCFMRPNKCAMGSAVWNTLSMHPDIVSGTQKNSGDTGIASRQAFAALFELDEVNVGDGWYNSAALGQTPVLTRLWPDSLLLYYDNAIANIMNKQFTFGGTAQWGTRRSGSIVDPDVGANGGIRVRAVDSVKELIFCSDLAFLFDDCLA